MTPPDRFLTTFFALPEGTFYACNGMRRYVISRTVLAQGKAHKLVAHQLGGPDYISLNLYLTRRSGAILRPCEMPAEKVIAFVIELTPDVQK